MKKFLIKSCSLAAVISFGCGIFCFGDGVTCKSCNASKPSNVKQEPKKPEVAVQPSASTKSEGPMGHQLMYTSGDKTVTLAELVKDKKAVLLDFYATWCGPCMKEMPALQKKSQILLPQGVDVVGINIDRDDRTKAEKLRQDRAIDFHWVMDSEDEPHSKYYDVTTVPRMVLLSQSGEVLFNGHPQDAKLQEALKKLGVSL